MGLSSHAIFPVLLLALALYVAPVKAFGAGNIASISKIEGANWRHGDLEDTLLQMFMAAAAAGGKKKKFSAMDVKRIYFGNWLRDYSQAIDTGALKYVEAETVRILLWILSFMTFGYATGEFEVTRERLGCYRPEEHIDNPKDYNDNNDAREMDRRLRGPVDEEIELGIDGQTGMKNYIANERIGRLSDGSEMATSAGLVRRLFTRSIELGRQYARNGNDADLFEAFRLMGTGLHCIEDWSAHSNYTELALIEMGETSVFPHVGARTMVNIQGRNVWPVVTGTFGGVDFLHSVLGEVNDKAMQSEISQLEHTISDAQRMGQSDDEQSIIRDLMSKLNIGGKDDLDSKSSELKQKSDARKQANESANTPYGLSQNVRALGQEIYPYLEFHDEIMRSINEALERVGMDILVEKLAEAVSVFVFCLLAPYILPILNQASKELKTGSSEVIASSEAAQHIVFDDDYSSNPTHSMLSKDHFTNLLNEPAGKIASTVLKFAVPLLMEAWDNQGINPNTVCDEIIGGVFHHPAFRNGEDGRPGVQGRQQMFAAVEEWWNSKDSQEQNKLRECLSREGVQAAKNHKAGVHDSGHGCGKPITRKKPSGKGDIGSSVGEAVGGALENALSGGVKGGDSGFGGLIGGFIGSAISDRLGSTQKSSGGKESASYGSTQKSSGGRETSSYDSTQKSSGGWEPSSYGGSGRQESSYEAATTTYGSQGGYGSSRQETTTSSYSSGGYGSKQETYSSSRYTGGQVEAEYVSRDTYQTPEYSRTTERSYETPGYSRTTERSYETPDYSRTTERSYETPDYSRTTEQSYESSYSRRKPSYGDDDNYLNEDEEPVYGQHHSYETRGGYPQQSEYRGEAASYYSSPSALGASSNYLGKTAGEEEKKKEKKKKEKKKEEKKKEEEGGSYSFGGYSGGYGGGHGVEEKKVKDKKEKEKDKKDKKKYEDEEEEDEGKKEKKDKKKDKKKDEGEDDDGYKKKEKKYGDHHDDYDKKSKKYYAYGGGRKSEDEDDGKKKEEKKYRKHSGYGSG